MTQVAFSRFIAMLLLILSISACNNSRKTGSSVTEALKREIGSGAANLDVAAAASDFEWETMYVFGPYSPQTYVCQLINVRQAQCAAAGVTDVDEGEFELVFLNKGSISRVEFFPRLIGNFEESERCQGKPILRGAARFVVTQKGGSPFLSCTPGAPGPRS
jgi:hypothetical protein